MDWTPSGGLSSDIEDRRDPAEAAASGARPRHRWDPCPARNQPCHRDVTTSAAISRVEAQSRLIRLPSTSPSRGHGRPPVPPRRTDRPAELALKDFLGDVQKHMGEATLPRRRPAGHSLAAPRLFLSDDDLQPGCGTAQSQTGPGSTAHADEKAQHRPKLLERAATAWRKQRGLRASRTSSRMELGHHVQDILRIEQQWCSRLSGQDPFCSETRLSVDMELQADCPRWSIGLLTALSNASIMQRRGYYRRSGMARRAAAVGDDHLQRMERGA